MQLQIKHILNFIHNIKTKTFNIVCKKLNFDIHFYKAVISANDN